VVRIISATWHTHSCQKTLFELFQARGGGGLAPESPTVNEGAVAPQVAVLVVVLPEAVQRVLVNH